MYTSIYTHTHIHTYKNIHFCTLLSHCDAHSFDEHPAKMEKM